MEKPPTPGVDDYVTKSNAMFDQTARAPAGKPESTKPLLDQINASVKAVPEYEQAFQAILQRNFAAAKAASNAAFQAIHQQGEANMQAMQQRHNEYMQWQNQRGAMQRQQFQNDMARKDSQHQNFMDYVLDQQYYKNPETGATVTVCNVPGATGVITPSTVNGNWVQLAPISHE